MDMSFGIDAVGAAFFKEKIGKFLHLVIGGRDADHLSALALLSDEPGLGKDLDVMGERRAGDADAGAELANGQALGPGPNQGAEHRKALLRAEGCKARSRCHQREISDRILFHDFIFLEISK